MYDQLYVDDLLEMVMYEDNIEDYKQNIGILSEGKALDKLLYTYRLKKEDLSNPSKVKDAIKHIELENKRGNEKRSIAPLITFLFGELGIITSNILGIKIDDRYNKSKPDYNDYETDGGLDWEKFDNDFSNHIKSHNKDMAKVLIGMCASIAVSAGSLIALNIILNRSDYDRFINACEKEINKIDKALKKLNKIDEKDSDTKKLIDNLEKSREGLNKTIETLHKAKKEAEQKKIDEKKKAAMDRAEIRAANTGKVNFTKNS